MKSTTYELIANLILVIGSIAAVLAFAAYNGDAEMGQLAFFVGALLQGLIILVPTVFMWGVLRGVADIKRDLKQRHEAEEHAHLAHLLEDESVQKVIVKNSGGESLVIESASEGRRESVPEERRREGV